MASLLPERITTVYEPTPGIGNLVRACEERGFDVYAESNFFDRDKNKHFDAVIGNPPFSKKYAFGMPEFLNKHGMRLGYHILTECLQISDITIALMPWFTISDSDKRLRALKNYGLKSLTALPRKTFEYARIQTVVIELVKGYKEETLFKVYDAISSSTAEQILINY